MTPVLGKRKRRAQPEKGNAVAKQKTADGEGEQDLKALFARHFEAQFKPLDVVPVANLSKEEEEEEEEDSEQSDSEWDGISSEGEEENVVEVVDYAQTSKLSAPKSKSELRGFMSSKPPSLKEKPKSSSKKTSAPDSGDEAENEAMNLKNDVALQQLLRESHLLDPNADGSLNPTGKNRHRALDLRLQAIGSKTSIYKQEKMPMAHRKGIAAKAKGREEKRRQEAKENGIILEKPTKEKKKSSEDRRDRGIGGPSVGKFRGGTLTLSKKDLRDIQGAGPSRGKGKRR